MKIIQYVIWQSHKDKFELQQGKRTVNTSTLVGSIVNPNIEEKYILRKDEHSNHKADVGKLLHVTKWTRPETYNAVLELMRVVSYLIPRRGISCVDVYIIDNIPNCFYILSLI